MLIELHQLLYDVALYQLHEDDDFNPNVCGCLLTPARMSRRHH